MELAKIIFEMNKRLIIGLLALAVALALSLSAKGANANEPYIVTGEDVSVSGINYRGTILEDVNLRNGTNGKQCKWVNGGYNSGRSVNGGLTWFHDPAPAKICKNSNSPTGWVKVKGGQSGRNCGNPYKPHGQPPGPVINGPVVMVHNFNRVNMTATAKAEVNLSEAIVCPDGSILNAQSTGFALAKVKITRQMLMSAQGNVDNLEAQLKDNAKAQAIARAEGKIEATCGTSEIVQEEPEEPETPTFLPPTIVYQKPPPPPPKPAPKPEQPVYGKVQPTELPNTGPGAVVATFIGVSSLSSFAFSAITRRSGL